MKTYGDDPRMQQVFDLLHEIAMERRIEVGPAHDPITGWGVTKDRPLFTLHVQCEYTDERQV